jgi:hypothetical protein
MKNIHSIIQRVYDVDSVCHGLSCQSF